MSSFNDSSGGETGTQKLGSLIDSQVITHGTAAHVEEGEKNGQHHDSPDETHSVSACSGRKAKGEFNLHLTAILTG
jgi:hypothetical protein